MGYLNWARINEPVHFNKQHGKVLVDMLYRETQTND